MRIRAADGLRWVAGCAAVLFAAGFLSSWLVTPVPGFALPLMLASLAVLAAASLLYWAVAPQSAESEDVPVDQGDRPTDRWRDEETTSEWHERMIREAGGGRLARALHFGAWWVSLSVMALGVYEIAVSDGRTTGTVFAHLQMTLEVVGAFLVGWVATRCLFFAARKGWVA